MDDKDQLDLGLPESAPQDPQADQEPPEGLVGDLKDLLKASLEAAQDEDDGDDTRGPFVGGGERVPLYKFNFVGRSGEEASNVIETPDEITNLFRTSQAIPPPYDPVFLYTLFEVSGALRTNIEAYKTNIDGYGHTFAPVVDLDDDESFEKIRSAMEEEQYHAAFSQLGEDAQNDLDPDSLEPIGDQQVEEQIQKLRRKMRREQMRLDSFFDFCCVDESFTALRKKTRQDLECIGNGYWEVLRNMQGELLQLVYVPGHTVRILPLERHQVPVTMKVKRTVLRYEDQTVQRRFRKFVQVMTEHKLVYFKEFGDERIYSSRTGCQYATLKDLAFAEPGVRAATEILHFKIHNPRSPYGVPRWISELVSVLGTRNAQEVNLGYFQHNSVPPLAVLVSGGRLSKDTATELRNHAEQQLRGKNNVHRVWVLQAESPKTAGPSNNGNVKVDIQPLTSAQKTDAQHLNYIERNEDMVGAVFRVPRLLRGVVKDFNRATAQASLEFAEQQVFAPERNEFDFLINRKLLPELGISLWRLQSKTSDFSDAFEKLKAINETAKSNYMLPGELRSLAGEAFGRDLAKVEDPWAYQPIAFTLAGIDATEDGKLSGTFGTVDPLAGYPEPTDPPEDTIDDMDLPPDKDDDAGDDGASSKALAKDARGVANRLSHIRRRLERGDSFDSKLAKQVEALRDFAREQEAQGAVESFARAHGERSGS